MDTKATGRVEIKDADRGEVDVVFSTLNVIDSDGDVTPPGAFEEGAPVRISAYGHTSWSGILPVGKGAIRTVGNEGIMSGRFFMDTTSGRDTFLVVKELGEMQEWSYGYDPVEFSFGEQDGQRVRFLNKLKVHEVSPVLLGAGVGTRTLAAKAATKGPVRAHSTETSTESWDASAVVAAIPDDASAADLRSVFAWVDPQGDPASKSSYKFPHHNGVGGAANLRACTAAIAALNGARGGSSIPDADRKGVYDHLARHLRDGDREVPELSSGPAGALKFHEEAASVLAGVSGLLDRAAEVVALRATKGKVIAAASAELLEWVEHDLGRFKTLLAPAPVTEPTPVEDGALGDDDLRTLMAALARVHSI